MSNFDSMLSSFLAKVSLFLAMVSLFPRLVGGLAVVPDRTDRSKPKICTTVNLLRDNTTVATLKEIRKRYVLSKRHSIFFITSCTYSETRLCKACFFSNFYAVINCHIGSSTEVFIVPSLILTQKLYTAQMQSKVQKKRFFGSARRITTLTI